jgi:hypothetical protein
MDDINIFDIAEDLFFIYARNTKLVHTVNDFSDEELDYSHTIGYFDDEFVYNNFYYDEPDYDIELDDFDNTDEYEVYDDYDDDVDHESFFEIIRRYIVSLSEIFRLGV